MRFFDWLWKKPLTPAECIANLKSSRKGTRLNAAKILGNEPKPSPGSISALIIALDDQDHDVRKAAALALGQFGEKSTEALPVLMRMICEDSICLGKVLGKIGRPAVPHAIRLISQSDHFAFAEGLYAIIELGPIASDAIPTLRALKDKHSSEAIYVMMIDKALKSVVPPNRKHQDSKQTGRGPKSDGKKPGVLTSFEHGLRALRGLSLITSGDRIANILFQMWRLHYDGHPPAEFIFWKLGVDGNKKIRTLVIGSGSKEKKHEIDTLPDDHRGQLINCGPDTISDLVKLQNYLNWAAKI